MSEFSPGTSPGINAFLEAAKACFSDPKKVEQVFLREHAEHIQSFRRGLERDFVALKKVRPPTPLYRRTEPKLNRQFEEFRDGMKLVETFLQTREPATLAAGCQRTRDAVDELSRLSLELKQEEDGFASHCDSPPVREIAVMLESVLRREMDFQPLTSYLESFSAQIKQLGRDLNEWKKSNFDSVELDELFAEMQKSVTALGTTLADLLMACNAGAYFELDIGKRPLIESGQRLWDLHASWMAALSPPVHCPHCAHVNDGANKFCESCHARLVKTRPEQPTSTVNVSSGEASEEPNRMTNIVRVEQAALAFSRGDASRKDLEETINWFKDRVKESRQALRGLKPGESTPKQDLEDATKLHKLMELGAEQLQQATQMLQQYAAQPSQQGLENALDKLLSGEAAMLEAYKASAQPAPAEPAQVP